MFGSPPLQRSRRGAPSYSAGRDGATIVLREVVMNEPSEAFGSSYGETPTRRHADVEVESFSLGNMGCGQLPFRCASPRGSAVRAGTARLVLNYSD